MRNYLFMGEGSLYSLVPELFLSSGVLDFHVYFIGGGHNECPEMSWLEDDDVVVVLFALVVVVATRQ